MTDYYKKRYARSMELANSTCCQPSEFDNYLAIPREAFFCDHCGDSSTSTIQLEFVLKLMARLQSLESAAEKVLFYDWSDNDDDAVAAVEELRRATELKSPN